MIPSIDVPWRTQSKPDGPPSNLSDRNSFASVSSAERSTAKTSPVSASCKRAPLDFRKRFENRYVLPALEKTISPSGASSEFAVRRDLICLSALEKGLKRTISKAFKTVDFPNSLVSQTTFNPEVKPSKRTPFTPKGPTLRKLTLFILTLFLPRNGTTSGGPRRQSGDPLAMNLDLRTSQPNLPQRLGQSPAHQGIQCLQP